MWWKGRLIDGGVGRVPKNWVHQEFHIPTFSNVMEQTSPLTKYNDARAHAGSACRGLKAKGMEYWGQATPGGPLESDGISSEAQGCDIKDVRAQAWYWGILGWHGQDIGSCWLSVVSTNQATKRGPEAAAKAHFSLSRFGDYPISLTLTSLISSGEF